MGPVSPWYLVALGASLLGAAAVFYICLFALQGNGRLPPPAFSNSLCVDEKLEYLRAHHTEQPNLLVIGSSVAWRHFDGEAARKIAPGVKPLNGAFCGLSANQSVFTANWLLDRNPSVRDVVMIASPLDFEDCTGKPTAVFDRKDVDGFVYGDASRWPSYTRYFDPISLARNAGKIADQRSGVNKVDPLVFDRYADGPLDNNDYRGLLYGALNRQDPACFKAMADLSARLTKEGRRLMIVATPMRWNWKDVGRNRQFIAEYNARLAAIPGAEFWDGDSLHMPEAAFFDAVHIRWSTVAGFTEQMARHFHLGEHRG